jgi:carboxymethylenebutenolidase
MKGAFRRHIREPETSPGGDRMDLRTKAARVSIDVEGARMGAYLAEPEPDGFHPTVLVGFEMFGVTAYVKSVADRIAALGYTAIVPDFYHRLGDDISLDATAEGRTKGLALLAQVNRAGVAADAAAALAFGKRHVSARAGRGDSRAAMFGMSVGGHIAYYAATQVAFDALVVLYPGWLTETTITLSQPEPTVTLTPSLAAHGTRVLLMTGGLDHLLKPEHVAEVRKRLDDAKVKNEIVVYPEGPHGFFCDERDTFRPEMAKDAWARIEGTLREALG